MVDIQHTKSIKFCNTGVVGSCGFLFCQYHKFVLHADEVRKIEHCVIPTTVRGHAINSSNDLVVFQCLTIGIQDFYLSRLEVVPSILLDTLSSSFVFWLGDDLNLRWLERCLEHHSLGVGSVGPKVDHVVTRVTSLHCYRY